jgi:hypothetical protein
MSLYGAIVVWEDRAEESKPEDLPNLKIGTAFEEKAPGDRRFAFAAGLIPEDFRYRY